MFISDEENKRRHEHPRNIFGPNYVPRKDRLDAEESTQLKEEPEDKGSHTGDSRAEDSPSLSTKDLDRILTGAVVEKRGSYLYGNVDAQVAVGGTAFILGATKAGNLFGKSLAQADAYGKGLSSPTDMKEMRDRVPERTRRLKSVKEQLAEKAGSRLNTALDSLTENKITELNASRISAIAKDMAVVMDKVSRDHDKAESIHFHIFRPEMKSVSEYTTVNVSSPLIINSDGGS